MESSAFFQRLFFSFVLINTYMYKQKPLSNFTGTNNNIRFALFPECFEGTNHSPER